MAATSARRILIVDDEGIIHERLRADELQRQSFAIRKNRNFIGTRASLASRTGGGAITRLRWLVVGDGLDCWDLCGCVVSIV